MPAEGSAPLSDVAKATVTGLSTQPILLLVAVLNVIMIASLYFVAKDQSDERGELQRQRTEIMKALIEKGCGGASP
jgi:hypothetical protein